MSNEDPDDERDGKDDPFDGRDAPAPGEGDGDPFDELDAMADVEVGSDPFEGGVLAGDEFDEVDVETLSEDAVWAQFGADDDDGDGVAVTNDVENEMVVPKRSYCEQCEFFADPPDVACDHPGTTIAELVDMTHFRVTDCPVVAQRKEVGELTNMSLEDQSGGE